LGRFFLRVLKRFNQDRCLQLASSLTFTTLLARCAVQVDNTLDLPLKRLLQGEPARFG
jgi:hypothetical protein